jgi:DNA-binding MarR family transcriptional regulator
MSKELVKLVNIWDRYSEEDANLDIKGFCLRYLSEKAESDSLLASPVFSIEGRLISLVNRLNRFAGMYSKKALVHSELNNLEDWGYLITLNHMGSPKKSELISELISEFPSGIEVIKRLLNNELAEEFMDPMDRRSKRLKLTDKGRKVLFETMYYMKDIALLAFGPLTNAEKQLLMSILEKLDGFHLDHYKETRASDYFGAVETLKNSLSKPEGQ